LTKILAAQKEEIRFSKESYENLDKQHANLNEAFAKIKVDFWNSKQRVDELEASTAEHERIAARSNEEKSKVEATNAKLVNRSTKLDAKIIQLDTKIKNLEFQNVELQKEDAAREDDKIRIEGNMKFLELKKAKLEQIVLGPETKFPTSGTAEVVASASRASKAETKPLKEQITFLEELNKLQESDIADLNKQTGADKRRIAQLEEALVVHKEFVNQDGYDRTTPRVVAQLKEVGLYKDTPRKEWVSGTYFEKIKQRGLSEHIRRSAVKSHRDCDPMDRIVWES
jgi:chromosome segregation ATPase